MAKFIHNLTENLKTYQGREIQANSVYRLPPSLYAEYAEDNSIIIDLTSGDIGVSRDGINLIETLENAINFITHEDIRVSLALDKDGIDQYISGTNAVVIQADRVLWDLNENYDVSTDDLVVPVDGVYSFDCQIKLTNLSNVASVELAIFKRGSPDDYWFILDNKSVGSLSDIQLSGATSFDFYKDERYTLKIILTKVLPLVGCSCTIEGNDDFTAWGYSLSYPL